MRLFYRIFWPIRVDRNHNIFYPYATLWTHCFPYKHTLKAA